MIIITTDITNQQLIEEISALKQRVKELEQSESDLKQADSLLRESEYYYRALASGGDSLVLLDRDCRYLFANEAYLDRFSSLRGSVIGRKYEELHDQENSRIFADAVKNVYDTGNTYHDEWLGTRSARYWLRTFSSVKDSEGIISAVIVAMKDISGRKKAEEQLQHTLVRLRNAVGTTIQVMASAVEARDPYTAGHQIRSADLSRAIASEMGLPQDKIEGIRIAASIHDIGKLSIPAEILSKPIKLSDLEFSLIKKHAQGGFEMLKDVESPWPLAEIVYQHHERMDGSGYPRNLKGEEICMEARILTVADVVEAMASHRPYRPGLGIDAALNEIEKNRGIFYDNVVADACLRLFREKGFKLAGT